MMFICLCGADERAYARYTFTTHSTLMELYVDTKRRRVKKTALGATLLISFMYASSRSLFVKPRLLFILLIVLICASFSSIIYSHTDAVSTHTFYMCTCSSLNNCFQFSFEHYAFFQTYMLHWTCMSLRVHTRLL